MSKAHDRLRRVAEEKNRRKSFNFKKYASAVRDVVKEELSSFEYLPDEIEENQRLLWNIKEMLQDALVGAYLAPPPKHLLFAIFDERFPCEREKRDVLDALKVALDHAQELLSLLRSASPIVRELLIANLRGMALVANATEDEGMSGTKVGETSGEA
jgi:hypothetical protein